jgi:microcystin-dependent protein
MPNPFLGEIRLFAFGQMPGGWAACDGSLLSVSNNLALFAVIGATYGGDGQNNFALPDLRGRAPLGLAPNTFPQGQAGGAATHALSLNEMPAHQHAAIANLEDGQAFLPAGNVLATTVTPAYHPIANLVALPPDTLQSAGQNQPHENMQPFLTLNFGIALAGIFPPRATPPEVN